MESVHELLSSVRQGNDIILPSSIPPNLKSKYRRKRCSDEEFFDCIRISNLPLMEIYLMDGGILTEHHASHACMHGNVKSLRWLREHNCPWDSDSTVYAATIGSLPCLEYLRVNNCPSSYHAVSAAVNGSHLKCTVYLLRNGAPCPRDIVEQASIVGDYDVLLNLIRFGFPVSKRSIALAKSEQCRKLLQKVFL